MAKPKNNTQALKSLIKDLENTPHSIGLALLRERLLTLAKSELKRVEKNPELYDNPLFSAGMYKDLYGRIVNHLKFDK